MTRAERLDPIIQHIDKKQQVALKAVLISQSQVGEEENKLQQLNAYRSEYLNRQQQSSCAAMELQEYHRFLEQLDLTIKQQLEVIKHREFELEQKRKIWQETRVNSKVMHKAVDNLQQQEDFVQQRIEQKALDEFSLRRLLK
ncbi:MAG: flagellar export protein FliJ [Gammaproteobacteria bacterium]|nr:flagellar export protein FliJ [Gammaproteobacteria bacterium]